MRHNKDSKRFNRRGGHLKAMLMNMTNDVFISGGVRTTSPRAKEVRRYVERMITLGKTGTVAARRRAMAFLRNKTTVTKLFDDIAPTYKDRNGGYTRILKVGIRPGDAAPMSMLQLVEGAEVSKETTKKAKPVKKEAAPKKAAPKPKKKTTAAAPKKETKAKPIKKEAKAKEKAKPKKKLAPKKTTKETTKKK